MKEKIHFHLEGEGSPLVFVHGLLGFSRNFYSIAQALKGGYQCLLYDQRGHGQSLKGGPYRLLQLVLDLKELLDFLKLPPVYLVGHSLGGYVSLLFSDRYPEYVKKLVLVDSNPWPGVSNAQEIKQMLSLFPPSFPDRKAMGEFFQKLLQEKALSLNMAGFLKANMKEGRDGDFRFVFDTPGVLELLKDVRNNQDYPLWMKNLKMPTLILRGEKSGHFSKSDFEKSLKLSPQIIGQEIPGSGHWIPSEQPRLFILALKEFLKEG